MEGREAEGEGPREKRRDVQGGERARGGVAGTRLEKGTAWGEYGLGEECKECGGKMITVAPLKYSPEDAQGARRRQRENAGSDEWIEKLPTPRKGDEEE